MMSRIRALREAIRTGFWAIPSACVLVAIGLALGLVQADDSLDTHLWLAFNGGPDGAREVLSAISSSMITFTGLVFSITVVVLQLTSSQFSPRVLRTFLRDRLTQFSLGVFVATFVYSVTVLRTVTGGDQEFVPVLSTTVGLGLLLLSVGMFVAYIHHIATSIQVSAILAAIGAETRETIERRFPAGDDPRAALPGARDEPVMAIVVAPRSGVLTGIDPDRLVGLATAEGVTLRIDLRPGDFVPEGGPLVEVLGTGSADAGQVSAAITISSDRDMQQDVAFGLRQLVDIAERALSPGVNDPTTAVQALDQVHDLLRRLARRRLPDGLHRDHDGRVRLVTPPEEFSDYLDLALEEIDQYGAEVLQVQRRIDLLLADLALAARPEHRAAIERWRARRDRPQVVTTGARVDTRHQRSR